MITRKEIKLIESLSQFLKGSKAIVHSSNIKTVAIVMPIAHKDANITPLLFCFSNIPVYKIFAILIVGITIGFQSKVNVRKTGYFFK
jgi:hypothetical protein